ncbi:hypothetical protein KIW84_011731 [Lathyrus oleraceus]|uniref:Exocyst complex component EXOC6/Sec15 N-terminal domain-containing protein n=1 Tax=Pisum sativum TaxID=3888 RepID=A0A9D5BFP0_PEA|nr:hypothetical protein KIW84_011731 [Pisum sativum]
MLRDAVVDELRGVLFDAEELKSQLHGEKFKLQQVDSALLVKLEELLQCYSVKKNVAEAVNMSKNCVQIRSSARNIGQTTIGRTATVRQKDEEMLEQQRKIEEKYISGVEDLACTVRLQGPVPVNISHNLVRLRLGGNSLTGEVPLNTCNEAGRNLTYIELDNNQLTGLIPPESGSCKKLALLNLAENQLTDALPPELGNLISLQVLKLQIK